MTKFSSSLPQLVLVGVPNVGKSSLVNRLLGARQAIVHQDAHTTRDTAQHICQLGERSLYLRDTPGYAPKGERLHQAAMTQLDKALIEADVLAMVINASAAISSDERRLAVRLHKTGKPIILIANQIDKADAKQERYLALGITTIVGVSAHHNLGIEELTTAVLKALPDDEGAEAPEPATTALALIGRPNVGKSSLLNHLVGEDISIVSEEPGTTRDTITKDVQVEDQIWRFIDTAGIRRPGKIGRGVEKFSLVRTQAAIEAADICLLVLDIGELATGQDQRLAGLIEEAGRGLVIVVNKADQLEMSESDIKRVDRVLRSAFEFVAWAPYVIVSAETGLHIDELKSQIASVARRLGKKYSTRELNTLLEKIVAKQPPTTGTFLRPRLNYVVQTEIRPLTLRIFGTHPEKIHFSYKRYIENSLRASYDLAGVAVRVEFVSKYKQDREEQDETSHRRTR